MSCQMAEVLVKGSAEHQPRCLIRYSMRADFAGGGASQSGEGGAQRLAIPLFRPISFMIQPFPLVLCRDGSSSPVAADQEAPSTSLRVCLGHSDRSRGPISGGVDRFPCRRGGATLPREGQVSPPPPGDAIRRRSFPSFPLFRRRRGGFRRPSGDVAGGGAFSLGS